MASVCGWQAEEVKRRWRDGWNGAGAQRRCRAADGSPPLLRLIKLSLVTNAHFAERNRRGRGEKGATVSLWSEEK